MRQYSHWVTALAIELNALFEYIYCANYTQNVHDIQTMYKVLNWITDFKCMILKNQLTYTEPIIKFKANCSRLHDFKHRAAQNRGPKFTTTTANKLVQNTVLRLRQLLDYAIHNCHTFENRPHMCQTFYFLQNIMASTYTALRNEYLPLKIKTDIHAQLMVLHIRMAQISDHLKIGRLCMIHPVLINCPK